MAVTCWLTELGFERWVLAYTVWLALWHGFGPVSYSQISQCQGHTEIVEMRHRYASAFDIMPGKEVLKA